MSDLLTDTLQELNTKTVDELFTFLEGQGIYNEGKNEFFTTDRIFTCPLAQYLYKITGRIIVVSSYTYHEHNDGQRYVLPDNLSAFVKEADARIYIEVKEAQVAAHIAAIKKIKEKITATRKNYEKFGP